MHKSKLPKHTNNVERVELIIEEKKGNRKLNAHINKHKDETSGTKNSLYKNSVATV